MAGNAADVHNMPIHLPVHHRLVGPLAAQYQPRHVRVQHGAQIGRRTEVEQIVLAHYAGIVYQHVHPTVRVRDALERPLDVRFDRNVTLHRVKPVGRFLRQLLLQLFDSLDTPGQSDRNHAGFGQIFGNLGTDAGTGARHYRYLTVPTRQNDHIIRSNLILRPYQHLSHLLQTSHLHAHTIVDRTQRHEIAILLGCEEIFAKIAQPSYLIFGRLAYTLLAGPIIRQCHRVHLARNQPILTVRFDRFLFLEITAIVSCAHCARFLLRYVHFDRGPKLVVIVTIVTGTSVAVTVLIVTVTMVQIVNNISILSPPFFSNDIVTDRETVFHHCSSAAGGRFTTGSSLCTGLSRLCRLY
uniref:Uncharacterized protein n=1 Tax=Anopheles merus TaxID=30066 RepID=A0A182UXR5_ANOME